VFSLVEGFDVRVISRRTLREFWESRKSDSEIARRELSVWYKLAKNAQWANFGSFKQTFGSPDQVGNCVVYDAGNNRYRLIGRVNYAKGVIYILKVMDHREYDKKSWVDDCGCHKPPPRDPATAKGAHRGRNPSRPGQRGGT
jgi:mRNA interferase HigB